MTDALLPRQRVAILEYRLMKFETEQCLTLGALSNSTADETLSAENWNDGKHLSMTEITDDGRLFGATGSGLEVGSVCHWVLLSVEIDFEFGDGFGRSRECLSRALSGCCKDPAIPPAGFTLTLTADTKWIPAKPLRIKRRLLPGRQWPNFEKAACRPAL